MRHSLLVTLAALWLAAASGASYAAAGDAQNTKREVRALKITVLVTNLAGDARAGDGEWGYSALVEADGHKILYDTGASADMVLRNARALHVDLSDVEDVILSHNHWDHVSGLMALRREFAKTNPKAFSRIHVASRIFEPRLDTAGKDQNGLRDIRAEYLATSGAFIVHDKQAELLPGVWLTGPVPRPNPEKNWSPGLSLSSVNGLVEDNVPEDSALVINTGEGTIILTGCGHAGIINIAEYARTIVGNHALLAVVGGVHLFAATEQTILWTGARLKGLGIKNILAGHCTGIEATYLLRKATNLSRKTAVVSAVGSSFTLGRGIAPGALAQ
jgi:7,8-dihydropterin-6-yl-methyl-4-(beta-D-ribofuranosyl)aminobenzene 5'-phosphate synthase